MQISNIQNYSLYGANNVSFRAATNFERILPSDKGNVSRKTVKLINDLNACIDKEWTDIRKHKKLASKPAFHIKDGKKIITFEPVYSQRYPALLIDINEGKTSRKILMDRDNPNNFRYEKVVKTDHGSATLKSYNSLHEQNKEINTYVNNIIENNLERILHNEIWDRLLNRIEEAID